MTTIVCPIKTITRYYSLHTLAAKYTHAQNVLAVAKRVERSRSIVIIKHKYMLMCNHKIRINLMRCLKNSTARREIGQLGNILGHFSKLFLLALPWIEYIVFYKHSKHSQGTFHHGCRYL